MGKRLHFSALHLEGLKKFNYLGSNNPLMKQRNGKRAWKSDKMGGHRGGRQRRHCEDLAWHRCATCIKPEHIDCFLAHGVKDGSLHSFESSILHLLEVLISQIVHMCLVRLWGCSAPLASPWWQYWLQHNWETHNGDLRGESWKQASESQ